MKDTDEQPDGVIHSGEVRKGLNFRSFLPEILGIWGVSPSQHMDVFIHLEAVRTLNI